MKETVVLVFAIFISNVRSFEDNYYGLNKNLFHAFLEEVYGTNFRMETFIDMMWPKISEVVLDSMALPAVEIFNVSNNDYICATDTTIWAQTGKILNKKLFSKTKTKLTFEVEAELHLDGKPVMFEVAKKLTTGEASPTVPVSYKFKGPNKVKIVLDIANFISKRKLLTPKCMMEVKNIMVVELSEPMPIADIQDEKLKQIEKDYWRGLNSQMKVVITVGLVKAVNQLLDENTELWICSSEYFKNVEEGYKGEWEYSENYFKYCQKKTN